MAIIACPHCGEKITSRMKECPHCHASLTDGAAAVPAPGKVVQIRLFVFIQAAIIALGVAIIWSEFFAIMMARWLGPVASFAVSASRRVFLNGPVWLLPIGGVVFAFLPRLLPGKPVIGRYVMAMVSMALAGVGYVWYGAILPDMNVPPECYDYARMMAAGMGFAFPVFMGTMALASMQASRAKVLRSRLAVLGLFLALSVGGGAGMVLYFGMGVQGLSLSCAGAAILSLLISFPFFLRSLREFQTENAR